MPDINSSKFAKQFGITIRGLETLERVTKKKKKAINVCVPGDEMAHIRELWKNYEKVVEKNRHRKVVNKIRNLTHLGTDKFNKQESKRLNKLIEVFKKTDDYMHEAKDFFKNCRKHKEIEKYVKQIDEDYKTLFDKKGYLKGGGVPGVVSYQRSTAANTVQANAHLKIKHFMVWSNTAPGAVPAQRDKTTLTNNPHHDDYATHVKGAYEHMYRLVDNFCASAKPLITFLETTRQQMGRWDTEIGKKVGMVREYCKKFRDCADAVESLEPTVASCDDGGVKARYKALRENLVFWGEKFNDIDRRSTMTYMEALFNNATLPEYTAIMDMTKHIINCASELDRFAGGITSGSMPASELRNTFENAVSNYQKLTAILTQHTQQAGAVVSFSLNAGAMNDPQNEKQRKLLEQKHNELANAFNKLGAAFMKFEKEEGKFMSKYCEWKKEKKEFKRRIILWSVFGLFGLLTTGLQVFNPLLEGAIMRMPAPVDPLPTKA